jgi:sigma54-dependent transcription regulator
MGSNTKRRTTMAKLNRENRLREKRMEKEMRRANPNRDTDGPETEALAPVGSDPLDRFDRMDPELAAIMAEEAKRNSR